MPRRGFSTFLKSLDEQQTGSPPVATTANEPSKAGSGHEKGEAPKADPGPGTLSNGSELKKCVMCRELQCQLGRRCDKCRSGVCSECIQELPSNICPHCGSLWQAQERSRAVARAAPQPQENNVNSQAEVLVTGRRYKAKSSAIMREWEDTFSKTVAKLAAGTLVEVLERGRGPKGKRYLVRSCDSGDEGWVTAFSLDGKAVFEPIQDDAEGSPLPSADPEPEAPQPGRISPEESASLEKAVSKPASAAAESKPKGTLPKSLANIMANNGSLAPRSTKPDAGKTEEKRFVAPQRAKDSDPFKEWLEEAYEPQSSSPRANGHEDQAVSSKPHLRCTGGLGSGAWMSSGQDTRRRSEEPIQSPTLLARGVPKDKGTSFKPRPREAPKDPMEILQRHCRKACSNAASIDPPMLKKTLGRGTSAEINNENRGCIASLGSNSPTSDEEPDYRPQSANDNQQLEESVSDPVVTDSMMEQDAPHLEIEKLEDTCQELPNHQALQASGIEPLDTPAHWLQDRLVPMREALLQKVQSRMDSYDAAKSFPRFQDAQYEHRDGYEVHLRNDAVRELRNEMKRIWPERPRGPLWTIGGDSVMGGIPVRSQPDAKGTDLLMAGSLVEELELCEDLLRYRLLFGDGPPTGWVTVKVKDRIQAVQTTKEEWEAMYNIQLPDIPMPVLPDPVSIIALVAAHIRSEARAKRFKHTLRSIKEQHPCTGDVEVVVALSWSASTPELRSMVAEIVDNFTSGDDSYLTRYAVEQSEPHSQFQHMLKGLAIAEAELRERRRAAPDKIGKRSVWVMFGDDDDLWHSMRVAEYVNAIQTHPMLDGVGVFSTSTRANIKEGRRVAEDDMPNTVWEVDRFMALGRGARLDNHDSHRAWRHKLCEAGDDADLLPVPDLLPQEYFDFVPRLRIFHEYFTVIAPEIVAHRYCDLRLLEWLRVYPRSGKELGLEMSFFDPNPECWMYFYACVPVDDRKWERVLEGEDAQTKGSSATIGIAGHMSSEIKLEQTEWELAEKVCSDFQAFEAGITVERLARYWAAFRNEMELVLMPRHRCKMDQRVFDGFVWLTVNQSFGKFAQKVNQLPEWKIKQAADMVYKKGQQFSKTMAQRFEVTVIWHKPHEFLGPEPTVQQDDYMYDDVACQQYINPNLVHSGPTVYGQYTLHSPLGRF